MNIINVKAEKRTEVGSKGSRAIRRAGKIPCVLYGGEKVEYFTVEPNGVKHLIYTPDFKIAEIEVDGVSTRCIVKDLQIHPVTDEIVHIDFLRLIDDVKIKVELPVGFKGVSPGVKGGGKLIQSMRKVKVKALPKDLKDTLYVSIEGLELGDAVRVRDVEVGEGIEVMNPPATPVARVAVPRALKSATAGEAESKEATEEATEEAAEA